MRGKGGRFLPGTPTPAPITEQSAREYHQRRQELKREAMLAGALAATSDIRQRKPTHELEWVEVIAEANMHRAADPGNPKGVDASRLLLQETGLAEARGAEAVADRAGDALRGLLALAGPLMLELTAIKRSNADVVDGQVADVGAEQAADDEQRTET